MPSAPYRYSSNPDRASLRRRAIALCLALAANLLLLLMLLRVAPLVSGPAAAKRGPVSFQLLPDAGAAGARAATKATSAKGAESAGVCCRRCRASRR